MAITTYLHESEIEKYKSVQDKQLNELFQEIRSIDERFLLEEKIITTNRLLRKPLTEVVYTLYIELSIPEVQMINFAREWSWSINTCIPASYIYAYFYGFLNGIKSQIKETKQFINH